MTLEERSSLVLALAEVLYVKGQSTGQCASKISRSILQPLKLIDVYLLFWLAQQRVLTVLGAFTSMCKTSAQLRLENLALRQQLMVLRRSAPKRLKLTPADR
ncbi:MAG TPA: hypothetical protein VHZ55_31025, partial [Bryobacteraceae bacterium]|nr:hypothetical protein [Bryobacteraceae bacterium]